MAAIDLTPVELLEAESWGDFVDPLSFLRDDPNFGVANAPISLVGDRHDGGERRLIETETHLAAIRGQARVLFWSTPFGQSAVQCLQNYTIGSGFEYKLEEKPGFAADLPKGLLLALNDEVTRFLDTNDWCGSSEVEGEILMRTCRDGESFISLSVDRHRRICARLIDPEQVVEPTNARDLEDWLYRRGIWDGSQPLSWSFGLITPSDDVSVDLALHVQWSQSPADCDVIPSSHFEHLKRNTDSTVKRGISDFFPIRHDLEREAKLRRNTAEGAALQAAIAWVQEMPAGATQTATAAIASGKATSQFNQPTATGSTRTVNKATYNPGTILRLPSGAKFTAGPMGAERIPDFMAIAGYVLRAIGTRWNMPEYMISGDASNANYASTMVAESPFVKARQADQRYYAGRFRNVMWKVLRIAYQIGRFDRFGLSWADIERLTEVHVTCPDVDSRNKTEKATVSSIEAAAGILSKRTWAAESGRNFDDEQRNIREETGGQAAGAPAPVDGTGAVGAPPVDSSTNVAALAMNGAQISSMVDIIAQISAGQLPVESARAIIAASFPTLTAQQIDDILKPLVGFKPAVMGEDGQPVPQADNADPSVQSGTSKFSEMGRKEWKNHDKATQDVMKAITDGTLSDGMAAIKLRGLRYDSNEVDQIIAEAKGGPAANPIPKPDEPTPATESEATLPPMAEIREQLRRHKRARETTE